MISTRSGATAKSSAGKSPCPPHAFRHEPAQEREAGRADIERVGIDGHAPRLDRRESVVADLPRLAVLGVSHAEVEGEPVVQLEPVVIGPALLVRVAGRGEPTGVRGFLLGNELLDLLRHLVGTREREPEVGAVSLPVDTRAVHRDEEARVRVVVETAAMHAR